MNELEREQKEHERQEDLARLRGLRPIDDDFMRCIFRDNIPLAQLVLRIVTGRSDLEVKSLETQRDMKRLVGARSICLDAYAEDSKGRKIDLEVKRSDHGAGKRRARYHSSCMDAENLDAGQNFDELPETYTIFITENDVLGKGMAVYPVERVNMVTGEPFEDGSYILYVNGAYRDESDIGKLMHDFSCWNPDDMHIGLLRETTRYYKENAEGVEIMCRAFEEVREEARAQGFEQGVEQGIERGIKQGIEQGSELERAKSIKMIMDSLKMTAEQAMDVLKIPKSDHSKYLAML